MKWGPRLSAVCLCGSIVLPLVSGCDESAEESGTAYVAKSKPRPELTPPRFRDVLPQTGITFRHHFLDSETGSGYKINPYDHGSGLAIADVNNDGLEDIYFLDFLGRNHLYINKGSMHFEEVAERAGVAVSRALSVGAAFGDYDNDGFRDLYVTTYRGGNSLFRNSGDGTFEDVTSAAGVDYNGHSSSPTWFDYDLDGDLDLYLCNIGKFTTETISEEARYFFKGVSLPFKRLAKAPDAHVAGEANILWRNNSDGTFTDTTVEAGLHAGEWNADAAVADFDMDGDPDIYVSNMFGANHLYRNRGNGTFEDVTSAALKRTSWGGMGCRFFDANGDARPDLYVVDMHSDMWSSTSETSKLRPKSKFNNVFGASAGFGAIVQKPDDTLAESVLFGNTFFLNRGGGAFQERSIEASLETWWPWSIATGDYNNDGAEDVFVASGMGYPYYYWPNQLMLNTGNGVFVEAAVQAGIEPPREGKEIQGAALNNIAFTRSSRATVTADLDNDGDLDIVTNNFNHEPYFLRNETTATNALRLKLSGQASNRDAIGARVKVTAGDRVWHRWVSNAEGYLSQSSRIVHVGLGPIQSVDRVEISWLGASRPQIVEGPPINEVVQIVQQ